MRFRKVSLSFVVLVAVVSFCMATELAAQDSRLHQILKNKEIRVGTSGDYPPFSYLSPQTSTSSDRVK